MNYIKVHNLSSIPHSLVFICVKLKIKSTHINVPIYIQSVQNSVQESKRPIIVCWKQNAKRVWMMYYNQKFFEGFKNKDKC